MDPHFAGMGGRRGQRWRTIRKSDGSFLQALHCDRCAICNHSVAICDRMYPTLKSTLPKFVPKFRGVPLGADPSCWGCKERTSRAN